MRNPFRYFNSSPEVIRLTVMMYLRYPLSLRQVEDLLFERGIDICHETIRFWWNRFGPMFANEIKKRRIQTRSYSHWRWHLHAVFVRINGETNYPSPALSILANAPATIQGRKVGILISDGVPAAPLKELIAAVDGAGAKAVLIAPKIGGVIDDGGKTVLPDHALSSAPSVFFDAVVLALSEDGATQLATQAAAVDFVRDAFGHLKIIGFAPGATSLLQAAGISDEADEGLVSLATKGGARAFVSAAKQHRIWSRELSLRDPG